MLRSKLGIQLHDLLLTNTMHKIMATVASNPVSVRVLSQNLITVNLIHHGLYPGQGCRNSKYKVSSGIPKKRIILMYFV